MTPLKNYKPFARLESRPPRGQENLPWGHEQKTNPADLVVLAVIVVCYILMLSGVI